MKNALTNIIVLWAACWAVAGTPGMRYDQDVIVFTANQGWLSRIYVLDMDGAVLDYFEYEYYIFSDLEIVDNELYATDWIAPRLYQIDIATGGLDVIVDDWSLYYMYDVACDGTYFYCKEWSLNRYTLDGTKAGSASFGETVRGSAWDGAYYWTLNDAGQIKCWNLAQWPTLTEIPESAFAPPTPACRGLWFDGRYFWTAESIADTLGHIYQFDYDGTIVEQWLAPAHQGYAAGVIRGRLIGDLNCDGSVNFGDINPFVLALTDPAGYEMQYPDCDIMSGDISGNGTVGFGDINPFVALLSP